MSVEIIKYGDPLKGSEQSVKKANLELVMKVTAQAKALCPVGDSGFLRGSIMWKVPGHDGGFEKGLKVSAQPRYGEGLVGSAMEYAQYVEFGTRKMAAQPYLRPAVILEIFGPNGLNTMKKKCIEEMWKSLGEGKKWKKKD